MKKFLREVLIKATEDYWRARILAEFKEDCMVKWDGRHRYYDCEHSICWHEEARRFLFDKRGE